MKYSCSVRLSGLVRSPMNSNLSPTDTSLNEWTHLIYIYKVREIIYLYILSCVISFSTISNRYSSIKERERRWNCIVKIVRSTSVHFSQISIVETTNQV
jgi:hypothetical protein